jgi:NAD+ synthase
MTFFKNVLEINCEKEARRISRFIQKQVRSMRREGAVIGLSGGVDSAVSAELCACTLGKERVIGLILPEKDSNPVSKEFALKQAEKMGIRADVIDITQTLEGFGTYNKRDELIKKAFPEYSPRYKMKITLPPDLLSRDAFNIYTLTINDGRGDMKSIRLNKETLRNIIAATDTKQRTRMMHLYYYAEKMNFLVCGTTNKTELIQGFFVKYGDGGVDIEPVAHLYKTQVFQMAEYLKVIDEIRMRTPSPDTFSFDVSDEDFYFRIPYEILDLLLYAWENDVPSAQVGTVLNLNEDQVRRAYRDFSSKYRATRHLRRSPPALKVRSGAQIEHSHDRKSRLGE